MRGERREERWREESAEVDRGEVEEGRGGRGERAGRGERWKRGECRERSAEVEEGRAKEVAEERAKEVEGGESKRGGRGESCHTSERRPPGGHTTASRGCHARGPDSVDNPSEQRPPGEAPRAEAAARDCDTLVRAEPRSSEQRLTATRETVRKAQDIRFGPG